APSQRRRAVGILAASGLRQRLQDALVHDGRRALRLRVEAGGAVAGRGEPARPQVLHAGVPVRRRPDFRHLPGSRPRRHGGRPPEVLVMENPDASFAPRRIVCLTEETTEWLYLLGEETRIVGISGYTVRPRRARE